MDKEFQKISWQWKNRKLMLDAYSVAVVVNEVSLSVALSSLHL
jgi:hypothetical protein